MNIRERLRRVAVIASTAALWPLGTAGAQTSGSGFLFQPPLGTVTLRTGLGAPLARSDIFDFTAENLTFTRDKLRGISAGADIGGFVTRRFELLFSGDVHSREVPTEYRDWQESNGDPIRQTTKLIRVPATVGGRFYLIPPGDQVGRFAWIPTRFTAYVGGGGGVTWYRLRQQGDFVDFNAANAIFRDTFESEGWAPTAMAMAGFDVALSPAVSFATQLRGTYARASLSEKFTGFQPIDLSGVSLMFGITLRAQ